MTSNSLKKYGFYFKNIFALSFIYFHLKTFGPSKALKVRLKSTNAISFGKVPNRNVYWKFVGCVIFPFN